MQADRSAAANAGLRAVRLMLAPRATAAGRGLLMRAILVLAAALPTLLGTVGSADAQQALRLTRQDRQAVNVTAYAPDRALCRGIAIISPGAGGSESGYRYLAESLSSFGYLAVVVGHPESGRRALREHVRGSGLREGLAELITDPGAYRGRFMDIDASRLWAEGRCNTGERVLVGHSMGAATAMIEAGARNRVGIQGADAFGVYIALSPQGIGSIFPENAWSGIRKPVLLLTGTRDRELGGASWETRTEPFRNMPPGCKWLGVIDGASHMDFAGNGMSRRTEALAGQTIGAFLDSVLGQTCRLGGRIDGVEISTK
jgi:predicted dienelactone hydrolase